MNHTKFLDTVVPLIPGIHFGHYKSKTLAPADWIAGMRVLPAKTITPAIHLAGVRMAGMKNAKNLITFPAGRYERHHFTLLSDTLDNKAQSIQYFALS